ncbi:hypothetical protein IQ243_07920 [Nostocales cyanobacterium LEGE 11386]|nr:hypothetical protein [Nostocales cyanobacterium LEGE 11386]
MAKDNYEEKYTNPDLRSQLKEEIKKSDKGGNPGQWSARKSQLLVREYEKHGGGYKQAEKDEAAKSLEEWSEQDWQTEEDEHRAREGEVTKRYLPKAVWDKLSDEEKQEAEQTKEEASREGKQHVEWTPAIKQAMDEIEEASAQDDGSDHEPTKRELYEQAKALNIAGRSKMNKDELNKAIRDAQS